MITFLRPAFLMLLFMFGVSSCRIYPPSFRTLENPKYEQLGTNGFSIRVDAVFHNPNRIRMKLINLQCDVLHNQRKLGSVGKNGTVKIAPRSDFRIPLSVTLKPEGSMMDNLKDLWNMATGKKTELFFEGNATLKAYGLKHQIPIRQKHTIDW